MANLHSSIYQGVVLHHRFRPKKHRFIYRVFSFCLDLDELPELDKKLTFFSLNRFNLFSFHEKDHGRINSDKKNSGELKKQITELLCQHGYQSAASKITLLCYPRILGYVFNPLSVYFCYNNENRLELILYEVSNTFGKRHTYLLPVNQNTSGTIKHASNKQLYVSPFMPMQTRYNFRIVPPDENISVFIQQIDDQESADAKAINLKNSRKQKPQKILNAIFTGDKETLSDKKLIKLFVTHPLMTLKVITAIHWEAAKLWLKGMSLQPRNKNEPVNSLSWTDHRGVTHHEVL